MLQARKKEFEKDMDKHLAMVDSMLEGRRWILEDPSLADFGIYGGLSPLLTVGRKIPARYAGLRSWVQRIAALGT